MDESTNSKITRVQPIFSWLRANADCTWGARLVEMANGVAALHSCGGIVGMELDPERKVPATPDRLRWMIKNADRLAPTDGRLWQELRRRVADRVQVERALEIDNRIPKALVLEGPTHADCLIECEHALIWIEGKRFDWLSPSIKWDVSRDQIARNVEAVWSLAKTSGKDYRMLICHESPLKHHEASLVQGYRAGTWWSGWPHVSEEQRLEFSKRIGTVTWAQIVNEWPQLRTDRPGLQL
jgi:hypothetical protein